MLDGSREKNSIMVIKRLRIVGLIFTTLFLCLGIKLYKIMIIDNAYAVQKINQQIYKPILYYQGFEFKGDIYDCNLKKLTNDGIEYRTIIVPQMVWKRISAGSSDYMNALSLICGDNMTVNMDRLINKIRQEYEGSKQAIILTVNGRTSSEIVGLNLPGIYIKEECRKYGDSIGLPIITNFINNTINNNDLKYEDSIDMKIFNLITRHSSHVLKVPVDALGNNLPGLAVIEEIKDDNIKNEPQNVMLTLDYEIQKIAEETLEELCMGNGAISIIDIKTGEVLAMASKDENGWERNMVTYSGMDYAYNPGSVFKTIVLAAALEEGKVDMETMFLCTGRSSTGISCYKRDGHGLLGLEDAFAQSCNVYFIELARTLGADKIISMAEKFGFGEKVINFSRESRGMLYKDKKDMKYDIGNIAIGQKDIMVTPLQVCDMISTIANGGIRNKPYILKSIMNSSGVIIKQYKAEKQKVISEETAKTIMLLLESVVSKGTGKKAQIEEGAAGKTGTPVRGIKTSSNSYQYEDSWFSGFFPAANPRFGVSVYIENTGDTYYGSSTAAVVFKNIAEKILLLSR